MKTLMKAALGALLLFSATAVTSAPAKAATYFGYTFGASPTAYYGGYGYRYRTRRNVCWYPYDGGYYTCGARSYRTYPSYSPYRYRTYRSYRPYRYRTFGRGYAFRPRAGYYRYRLFNR